MAYSTYDLAFLKQRMADKWAGSAFWTDAEAVIALNEALRVWNAMTGFWTTDAYIETQSGAFEYALPSLITFGTRVSYEGYPLTKATMKSMDNARPGWTTQTTATGGGVPSSPRHWIPMSPTMIAIWPADAGSDHALSINGISATPQLVFDTDYIDIGDDELNAILGYALHVAALKEGGERFAATMPYYKAFLEAAREENDQLTLSEQFRKALGLNTDKLYYPTRGKTGLEPNNMPPSPSR